MSKKQTAVQWLIENAKGFQTAESSRAMCKKALEMERGQIEEASFKGVQIGVMNCSYDKIENGIECDYSCAQKECSEYYTQTYQNEKETIELPNQVASS